MVWCTVTFLCLALVSVWKHCRWFQTQQFQNIQNNVVGGLGPLLYSLESHGVFFITKVLFLLLVSTRQFVH